MATIAAPSMPVFDDTGTVFRELGVSLTEAVDALAALTFRPGAFPEAQSLQSGVEEFCALRRQRLGLYAEGCDYLARIVALSGEVYAGTEKGRAEAGDALDSRLAGFVHGLQSVRDRLGALDGAGSRPVGDR